MREYATISLQGEEDFIRNLEPVKVDRTILSDVERYCQNTAHKILALSGLRRTGKTALMMRQALNLIRAGKPVTYILCSRQTNQRDLFMAITRAMEYGCKYLFVDEITYVDGFADWADWIYNATVLKGCHCIIAGTDSYGLLLAHNRLLYDRIEWLRSTYISFAEYHRVTGGDILQYVREGGVFTNIDVRDYVNASIVDNIVHSLQRYDEANHDMLDDLSAAEIKTMLIKILVRISFTITIGIIDRKYKHPDISSPHQLITSKDPSFILEHEEQIKEKAAEFFGISEDLSRFTTKQRDSFAKHLEDILQRLDVIMPCAHYKAGAKPKEGQINYLLTQPALRYQITQVYLTILEEFGGEGSELFSRVMAEDVEGRLLEAVVLAEAEKCYGNNSNIARTLSRSCDVLKLDGPGFDFDMVMLCKNTGKLSLYEIKRSDKIEQAQCKHLRDDVSVEKAKEIMLARNSNGAGITGVGKYVLYRGDEFQDGDVTYINVERFLSGLGLSPNQV